MGAKERGQVLVAVTAVSTVVALALIAFGLFVSQQTRNNRSQLQETQALFIAEAGVQRTIGYLQGQSNWASAALPSPNPLSLTDPTNQARVGYVTQSSTDITVLSYGYILVSGYSLPSASPPPTDKVRARATIQVTLKKVPRYSPWNYSSYSNDKQNYHGIVHGSVFGRNNDINIGTNEAVFNDFTYDATKTPDWLESYLNTLNPTTLKARVQAYNGDIKVTGSGLLGTAANPLAGVGVNSPHTINVSNYYGSVTAVPSPPSFPTLASTQLDGILLPASEYDYRLVAGNPLDPNNGCVWDGNLLTDGSKNLSLTNGGDVPVCTPYGSNGIIWDPANSKLTLNGTVFVDGDLAIGDSTYPDIGYVGRGTIVVNGKVTIKGGLHPQTMGDFPNNALLGIISMGDISLDPPNTTPYKVIAGAFYTGDKVDIKNSCIQVGSIIATNDVKTTGTPILYQIPGLSSNLTPGLPNNASTDFYITITNWKVLV